METAPRTQARRTRTTAARRPGGRRLALVCCLSLLAGCALNTPAIERALVAPAQPDVQGDAVAVEGYRIGCPDVLEVHVQGKPDLSGLRTVGPDGRIDLGPLGRVRVEGETAGGAGLRVAEEAGVPPRAAQVRVTEFNSQQIYLVGEVAGQQRAVPYRGPETVTALLHRVGGLAPGAAVGEVHVVRSHLAEGRTPEVYHIDLQAIVMHHDERTNLRLLPFDQVHVGMTREAGFARCMPPCLRPLFEACCGMRRAGR
jgi:protein involved in polysaccharide export with SLBB domain